jgi:formylglycine-generating enzyme required for sulfatase activity
MYLYVELWKAKDAWIKLTADERGAKMKELLEYVQKNPIPGVAPFSFHKTGDVFLFDGLTEERVVVDSGAARPTGYRYAAAWMVPTVDLIQRLEERVRNVGWWFDYFDWKNAWGAMDAAATVGDMLVANQSAPAAPFEGTRAGEERDGFCWCPPGSFKMGFEGTPVTLSHGFWIGKNLVTQEQYRRVMGENPSGFVGDSLPVESVNRTQVTSYCAKLTTLERAAGRLPEGWEYRSPTEAQWEYAARAGTDTAYSWGDNESQADEYVWHIGNSGFKTHPVGTKKPNPWGIYDTLGNTLEWCQDAWLERYPGGVDPEVTERDLPRRPAESPEPFWVSRGGGWFIPPEATPRVRIRLGAGDQGYLLGFRVAIVREKKRAVSSPNKQLLEWGDVMVGRWSSESFYIEDATRQEGHTSARWIVARHAIEGEFRIGGRSGTWIAMWDDASQQIKQHTVISDGSIVLTLISKQGANWIWKESAVYPGGETETGTDTVTVADGGSTLVHHVTDRVRGGRKAPDIRSVLRRVS